MTNEAPIESFVDCYPPISDMQNRIRSSISSKENDDSLSGSQSGFSTSNAPDTIFDSFKSPGGDICINKFFMALRMNGLRKSDPRIRDMVQNFEKIHRKRMFDCQTIDAYNLVLDRESFKECIKGSIVLILRAFRHKFIIPDWPEFCRHIEKIYQNTKPITRGQVATYIPQLARADPNHFGVAVCTIDGQRSSWGAGKVAWCMQSVSKALTYAIALEEYGSDVVHKYVGQEPSGRLFNEICLDHNAKPHNPMINPGAIVTVSLVKNDEKLADRFDYLVKKYSALAGNQFVGFSNTTFLSERDTADRNNALAYYLREHKCFPPNVNLHDTLDLYFQLCAVEVTCESAAVMAATLANGGVCPLTGKKLLSSRSVRDVLSLMYSCGMYDYSGEFAFKIGLPAKSGVSGGMILVVPNVLGLAIYSPRLGKLGNTVRGVEFCKTLVETFNFHNYDNLVHCDSHKTDPRRPLAESGNLELNELMYSAQLGRLEHVRRLVIHGADVNRINYDGRSALHVAAAAGHLQVVRYLLTDCKARTDLKDRWNRTALDDARFFAHKECVELLEKSTATPDDRQLEVSRSVTPNGSAGPKMIATELEKFARPNEPNQ